ncbi:hypothetical protein [Rhodanobacter sp. FW106-PBR-R2A-1-13]|uniref:hypothetical protein n=1 Tax=Rhodanobacter sp. FW106-PBR-R2A-1-13 TaxID=3454845 RepID=UPI0034E60C77
MSDSVKFACGGGASSYRVESRGGCTLVFGSIPIDDLVRLTNEAGPDTFAAPDLCDLTGASIAFGPIADIEAAVAELRRAKLAAGIPADVLPGWSEGARTWYVVGEHGVSSLVIFQRVTGASHRYLEHDAPTCQEHPRDPADLRRCRLLLEAAPDVAAAFRQVMPAVSPAWAALVATWDALCALMDSECPSWRDAGPWWCPNTYERMRSIVSEL